MRDILDGIYGGCGVVDGWVRWRSMNAESEPDMCNQIDNEKLKCGDRKENKQ